MPLVNVTGATHTSPHCIRVDFDGQLRNNAALRDIANYQVRDIGLVTSATILGIYVPTAQAQEFVGPAPDGGAPESVYIVMEEELYTFLGASIQVDIDNANPAVDPVDYYDTLVLGVATATLTASPTIAQTYGTDDGLRTGEGFSEFAKLGKAKFRSTNTNNYGIAELIGKLADFSSGGLIAELLTNIDGPLDTDVEIPPTFGPGGFALPDPATPGIGDTITLSRIPSHVDKLWGPCDGVNTLFRASIHFDPFSCVIYRVPNPLGTDPGGELELYEWFAPTSGTDRLIRTTEAPPIGSSLIAIYKPRNSLYRIGHEILACMDIDASANTALIIGRANLCTDLEEHAIGDTIEDVWATSFVGRARYSLFAFGAHGRPLEYIAHDRGVPHSDNPRMSFTELRRAIFNTSSQMRGTPGSAILALRYVFPDVWPYIIVDEDPRWPGCLTIWYSTEAIGDIGGVWADAPGVEPWETWLDHLAYMDGFPMDLYTETYFRDPITDVTYDGDYFLEDGADDPELWPFPVVVSGPAALTLGSPAPSLPDPYWVSDAYRNFIIRPKALDRVLPTGVGVLLLDHKWAV